MRSGGMKYSSPLRPASYQLVPLMKLLINGLDCVLISDGVGVGKTISAGYIVLFITTWLNQSGIIVCPPSLLIKWKEELESKFFLRAVIVTKEEEFITMENELQTGRKKKRNTIYIIPSSLINKFKLNQKTNPSIIVFDEIHNFRNNETMGYRSAKSMAKHAHFKVGLSATPINNSINDFVSELSILLPKYSFDSISIMIEDLWSRYKKSVTNALVTRFTKENLGIHFAKRIIKNYEMSFSTNYADKVKDIISNIPSTKNSFFEKVTYYRLAASSVEALRKSLDIDEPLLEIDPKITLLKRIFDIQKTDKWILFCEFSETAKVLQRELSRAWNVFMMTGETPLFERHNTIAEFREAKKSLLIMTPVGSEGLDIQFCNAVINYDLHWNPMKIEQRIGRVDRVGQKKKEIIVANIMVKGSIDERILDVIRSKLSLISNSVFNVPSVISDTHHKINYIFDKEVFEMEYNLGKNFLKSIKYWESLPELDYSILSKIDKDLCDITTLSRIAKNFTVDSLLSNTSLRTWSSKIKDDASLVQKRVTLYN